MGRGMKGAAGLVAGAVLWGSGALAATGTPSGAGPGLGGAAGAEAWYAYWHAEGGLDEAGVKVAYDIEPAVILGYSACLTYRKRDDTVSGIFVDYLTEASGHESSREAGGGWGYRAVRWRLVQSLSRHWLVHTSVSKGRFTGRAEIKEGAEVFGHEPGARFPVDAKWFKTDVLFLRAGTTAVGGAGYRYLKYNKPQAVVDFYGTEVKDGSFGAVELDQVVGGRFLDTEMTGHYLLAGVWDRSYVGLPAAGWVFFEFAAFIGSETIDNGVDRFAHKIGGGLEGALGVKYSRTWFDAVHVTGRLGYRGLYAKSHAGDEKGEDRNGKLYSGSIAEDIWHGPFVGLTVGF